ncbi:hypothetical protein Cgig2_024445 [Carnegiea gigantea]|uniref:NB-ARC domain-containing protein n=1 Tax=Carnegiea gigantea TaxID=171969 RepID=A0A9Q1KLY2_9CARY|nr:hypothetical protein Cgig2_024445 [Carnegiea gigantea]
MVEEKISEDDLKPLQPLEDISAIEEEFDNDVWNEDQLQWLMFIDFLMGADPCSGEIEICPHENVSLTDIYHRASLSAVGSLERTTSLSVADTKGKMIREYETEIESNLETEADSEIESRNHVAVSESGPTEKTIAKPEMIITSSESNILVQRGEVDIAEQIQISYESRISVPVSISVTSLETSHELSINPKLTATTPAQTRTFIQSEMAGEPSFQKEARQQNKIHLPPKVDAQRSIRCTVDKIFKDLGDAQSGSICLHGRGGNGKTTVLKTLFHYPASYIFVQVIFVTVPRLACQRKIQNEIMIAHHWMGLLEGRTSDSYRKGYEIVRDLVNASLLEATTNGCNKVFIIRDCERLSMLRPSIGDLRSLKVLDHQGTELIHLPESVSKLAKLKQLQASFYGSISHSECSKLLAKLIPDGVISRLDLEELGIFVHPGDRRWALSVSNIIKEVSTRKLHALYFHFPDEKHLDQFLDMNESWKYNLARFNFVVGHAFKHGTSQVSHDAEIRHHGERCRLRFVNGESAPRSVQKACPKLTYVLTYAMLDNLSSLEELVIEDFASLLGVMIKLEVAMMMLQARNL